MRTSHKKQHITRLALATSIVILAGLIVVGIFIATFTSFFTYTSEPETPTKEVVQTPHRTSTTTSTKPVTEATPPEKKLHAYVEIIDSCGPHFEGECVRVRSGPGSEYPVVSRVRNGMVLKVEEKVERDGLVWYKIIFYEWLRYPERITDDWYIAGAYTRPLEDEGDLTIWENEYSTTTKKIIVDRSEQKLYAYDGDILFMETLISAGLELTPTPRGTFSVFKKTPSRYMQGPLPGLIDQQSYDLPGVPWNLYFTQEGAVIHGAYWHNSFGRVYSHGCVNLAPSDAEKLYHWAVLDTTVIVRD